MRTQLAVLRLVHLRELRKHPLRTAITVVAVAAGVSMLLAIAVVVRSTTVSFENQASALAGPAPLRIVGVTSIGGVEPGDLATVRATPGVAAAAPMVRGLVAVERDDPDGGVAFGDEILLVGVECEVVEFFGTSCDALAGGMLVTPSVANVERADARLRTTIGAVPLAELDLRSDPRLEALGPRVAVTSLSEAQRLLWRHDTIDTIYVVPNDEDVDGVAEDLVAALPPGLDVLGATDVPPELSQVLSTIIPLFGLIGILAFGVGAILVANTVALSLEERRTQLAVVAALGGTRRHVLFGALVQAALLGAVGGLCGAGLAALAAYPLTDSVSQFTLEVAGLRVEALPSQTPVLAAVLLGVLVAVVAAWRPARRSTRTDIAAELSGRDRRDETSTRRLAPRAAITSLLGLVFAALAIAGGADGSLQPWQPPVAWLGLLGAVVSLSLAVGYVGALLASVSLRSVRVRRPAVHLALANLTREPSRTAVMVLAASAAIGVGYVADSYISMAEAGISEGLTSTQADGLSVSIGPLDSPGIFAPVPPDVVDAVAAHPMVGTVVSSAAVFASGEPTIGVFGIDGDPLGSRIYDGTADPADFSAGRAMIGAGLARTQDVRAGDSVSVPTRDGLADVPVLGVWANGSAVGNSVTVPLTTLHELYGPAPVGGMVVHPRAGTSSEQVAAALRHDIDEPALRVERPPSRQRSGSRGRSSAAWPRSAPCRWA